MQNIGEEKIEEIEKHVSNFHTILNKSIQWVNSNLKYEEKNKISLEIKNKRRVISKIKDSIKSKPVFALYGASQVGKSYLVKNLLSEKESSLKINNGKTEFDFLKDINPPGVGAESTGVVTRFTIEKTSNNDNYPIKLKLLTVKDIIIIICDSYFSDVKKIVDNYPSLEDFKEHIDNIEKKFGSSDDSQIFLIEDDILDIKEYFNNHFNKHSFIVSKINDSQFWSKIGSIIENIPSFYWKDVFGVLWGNNKNLNDLFSLLVSELENIKFQRIVYAPFDSVLRKKGEILDVKRLKELYLNNKKLSILIKDNEKEINLSIISALTSELVLQVSSKTAQNKTFLKNTDLLDFPGARSRLELESDSINKESSPSMFLRGKIAYLFNKYSEDYEINNLLFCTNDKQLDVNEIPSLLNNWIKNNIGETFNERNKNLKDINTSPLFVIFTFFNNQLKFDTTNDPKGELDYKWNTRFHRFFEDEIVTSSYNWHKNWLKKDSAFNNFFLLRDYKYSNDTYDGYEKQNIEINIKPEREEFLENLKHSFLNFPFVKNHFKDPLNAWDESTQLNKDGSELIIKNLEPAANNNTKISNYITQLCAIKTTLIEILNKYFHSDNISDKRIKANNTANLIQLEFNKIFGKNPFYFSEFIKLILIPENDAYNYFHKNIITEEKSSGFDEYTLFLSQFPNLSSKNSKDENVEILKSSMNFTNTSDVEKFLEERNIDLTKLFKESKKNNANDLIDGFLVYWQKNYLVTENFQKFIDLGLSKSILDEYLSTLVQCIENQNLKNRICSIIEEFTEGLQISREHQEYFASVSSQFLNDFITNFGYNFYSTDKLNELEKINENYDLNLSKISITGIKNIDENDIKNMFDNSLNENSNNIANLDLTAMIENYNTWLNKIKIALISNCGFVNYDVEANIELKEIIISIENLEFNID